MTNREGRGHVEPVFHNGSIGSVEPTITQGRYDRRRKYDETGDDYEERRYGDRKMQLYLEIRTAALVREIEQRFPKRRGLKILEVGCGTGVTLEQLAGQLEEPLLHGMDISHTMLRQASSKPHVLADRPCLLLGSGFCLPLADRSFDVVFATRFIHQFTHDEKLRLYDEFRRVLSPAGVLIVEFYASSVADWYESHLGSKRHKPRGRYQCKFPSGRQVEELVGRNGRRVPLSVAGSHRLQRVLGDAAVRYMTTVLGRMFVPGLVNDYFVISR